MAARAVFPLTAATDFGSQAFSGLLAGEEMVRREQAQNFLQRLREQQMVREQAEEGRRAALFPLTQRGLEADIATKSAPAYFQHGGTVIGVNRPSGSVSGTLRIPRSPEEEEKIGLEAEASRLGLAKSRREAESAAKVEEFRTRYLAAPAQERPALVQAYLPYIAPALFGQAELERIKATTRIPNLGERREGRIHNYLVNVMGYKPGSKEYESGFVILESAAVPVEGVGPFPKTALLGGGGPQTPAIPIDKPIGADQARQLSSAQIVTSAIGNMEAASADAVTQNYQGPIAQWFSTVQRMTPGALLGKVPPAQVTMEQSLRTLNTEYRRLATGAQMSAYEMEDIMGQLPQLSNQPAEFAQRLQNVKHNAQILQIMSNAALTKQQRDKMKAALVGVEFRPPPPSGPVTTPGSGLDIARRANEIATQKYGKPYGSLDEATRRAIFNEVTGGR